MDAMTQALAIAARQHGAIGSSQARSCGLSRHQIRHLVRSGRFVADRRAICVVAGTPDTWERRAWIALLACGDEAVLSHRAAGYVHGLLESKPRRIDITMWHRTRNGHVEGLPIHRAVRLEAADRRTVKGFPVTSPARTLVDLASELPDRALARTVDKALLLGITTIRVVRRYVRDRRLQRRPGVGRLLRLLDDREFGVPESELERRTLELIAEYRLPAPGRQQRVGRHRVDFAYMDQRVLVEVDGRATHGTAEAFEHDPRRQNALVLEGWTVLRFTWKQITQDPDYVADTMRSALE